LGLCVDQVKCGPWRGIQEAENTEETRLRMLDVALDQLAPARRFWMAASGFLLKELPDKALIRKGRDTKILRSVSPVGRAWRRLRLFLMVWKKRWCIPSN